MHRVALRKASPRDTHTLAEISKRAFHSDSHCGAPGSAEGPPGYASAEWQRQIMKQGDYYKVLLDGRIIGGAIVFRRAPREYELARIFIDPEVHNQGVGAQAMTLLMESYPLAKRWTLETPVWNTRTRHFYAKLGFSEIGFAPHDGVLFEKRIPSP
ncbi:MAG: GNAT family N-acetyltransferase [Anaerolineae bacterium]|nr:GNAT family N-acetyltransferase [Anaerolineae bacterium]